MSEETPLVQVWAARPHDPDHRAEVHRLRGVLAYIAQLGCDRLGSAFNPDPDVTCLEQRLEPLCHPCCAEDALNDTGYIAPHTGWPELAEVRRG